MEVVGPLERGCLWKGEREWVPCVALELGLHSMQLRVSQTLQGTEASARLDPAGEELVASLPLENLAVGWLLPGDPWPRS